MHLISLEPSTVLARKDSINIVHMSGYTLPLHTCMFNCQDINLRLQKEFIYITLCLCQSLTSHMCVQLGKESECQAGLECIQTQLPKLRFVSPSPGTVDCQIPLLNLCLVLFDVVAVQFLYLFGMNYL